MTSQSSPRPVSGAHTPGPWRVEDGTTLIWGDCIPHDHSSRGMGYPIAACRTNPSGNWSTGPYADEAEANARLIAAAPDLLAAVQKLMALNNEHAPFGGEFYQDRLDCAWDAARAALAKAEGRADG